MTALLEMKVVDSGPASYSVRRYYDPSTGQFVNVDPAVDQTEAPYAYVNGDPVNAADPLGLGCGFLSPGDCLDAGVNAFLGVTTAIGNDIANSSIAQPFLSFTTDIGNALGGAYYDFASAHPCIALGISTTAQIAGFFFFPEELGLEELAAEEASGIVASDGTTISGFTEHGIDRVIGDGAKRAGVKPQAFLDAIRNPAKITEGVDSLGRPYKIHTGSDARVVVNPETGRVVSANPLSGAGANR